MPARRLCMDFDRARQPRARIGIIVDSCVLRTNSQRLLYSVLQPYQCLHTSGIARQCAHMGIQLLPGSRLLAHPAGITDQWIIRFSSKYMVWTYDKALKLRLKGRTVRLSRDYRLLSPGFEPGLRD